MTLEEAKKILEKEFAVIGFHKSTEPFELDESGWIEHEKPSVLEAFRVLSKEGYYIAISGHDYDMRKKRLKKEYEKNTKAPGPGSPLSAVEGAKLKWKDNKNTSENPALKEAASKFNDALLDEQAKKIDEQNHEITRLLSLVEKKENSISRLHYEKSVLVKENEELKKGEIPARYFDKALVDEQSEKIKKLEHEKLDILEMASSCKQTIEELTKEKTNLEDQITILNACKEHNENIGRKQIKRLGKEVSKLNSIIHDKDAVLSDVAEELRLSKIREKNLTEMCQKYMKENEKLKKELADKVVDKIDAQALRSAESALAWKEKVVTYKDMALAYYEKKIAEKDKVIADLGNELAATKTELEEKTKLVETVRKGSKEYCEYGIAAEKMIQKMADVIVNEHPVSSKDFEQYRRWANGYRFNPQLPDFSEKEEKKFFSAKDTHPTEDKPEEVEMNEILEHVRKVLEEGGTVCTSYDKAEEGGNQSATIVQHRKSIVDLFKEIKRLWQE